MIHPPSQNELYKNKPHSETAGCTVAVPESGRGLDVATIITSLWLHRGGVVAEAGIRELRDHLSKYLDRVRRGEELTVTDRGRAIARVVPVAQPRAYDRLVSEGVIEPAEAMERTRPERRVEADSPVSSLVEDQRR